MEPIWKSRSELFSSHYISNGNNGRADVLLITAKKGFNRNSMKSEDDGRSTGGVGGIRQETKGKWRNLWQTMRTKYCPKKKLLTGCSWAWKMNWSLCGTNVIGATCTVLHAPCNMHGIIYSIDEEVMPVWCILNGWSMLCSVLGDNRNHCYLTSIMIIKLLYISRHHRTNHIDTGRLNKMQNGGN